MNPRKRAVERLFLFYTPIWTAIVALVMWTQAFTRWGDVGHMVFGVALALPLWLLPLLPAFGERGVPLGQRYAVKANLFIALLSFLQNYFGSPLFFRYFGMQYHFHTTWSLNGSPVFLSFLTVAYFSTYYALMQAGLRLLAPALARLPGGGPQTAGRWLLRALLSYSMAFMETLCMANDWLKGYFSYGDKSRMLFYGSLCYGTLFLISLPLFCAIDEDARRPTPLSLVLWHVLGANTLIMVSYEVFAWLMR